MKNTFRSAVIWGALSLGSLYATVCSADIAVIAHPSVNSAQLNAKEVRDIFLNRSNVLKLSQDPVITVFDLNSDTSKYFFKNVMRMTPSKFRAHWSTQIFTGKGVQPTYINNADELILSVANTPNAVGFVDDAEALAGVKVLFTIAE